MLFPDVVGLCVQYIYHLAHVRICLWTSHAVGHVLVIAHDRTATPSTLAWSLNWTTYTARSEVGDLATIVCKRQRVVEDQRS